MIQLIKNYFIKRRRIKIAKLVFYDNRLGLHEYNNSYIGFCSVLSRLNIDRDHDFYFHLRSFYYYKYGNPKHSYWFECDQGGLLDRLNFLEEYIKNYKTEFK